MNVYGILPIAGTASRISGIPKFLLPCIGNTTLLRHTVNKLNKAGVTNIIAGVTEINNLLLKSFDIDKHVVSTRTMTETVSVLLRNLKSEECIVKNILMMPDTFFTLDNELKTMIQMLDKYKIVVLVWKIQDHQIGHVGQCRIINDEVVDCIDKDPLCKYEHMWGTIAWTSDINYLIDPAWSTIGELLRVAKNMNIAVGSVIVNSPYYDCGTYSEYFRMIKNNS
jgi:UTP-glucose-1-phosphate uridylyltransferase